MVDVDGACVCVCVGAVVVASLGVWSKQRFEREDSEKTSERTSHSASAMWRRTPGESMSGPSEPRVAAGSARPLVREVAADLGLRARVRFGVRFG